MPRNNTSEYHNLDIEVGRRNGDKYPVIARSSLCGEDSGVLQLPYSSHEEFKRGVNLVYTTLREMRYGHPYAEGEQIVKLFGQELFKSLISENVHILYVRCIERAKSMKKMGLRLRLHITDPELSTVPWEYLYDPDRRDYISFYRSSPIIRYVDLQQPTEPSRIKLPLKLLCMISSPTDLMPLNVKNEKERMQKALKPLTERSIMTVEWLDNEQTYHDLQSIMRTDTWHIFHFIGHGGWDTQTGEGFLCFSDVLGLSHKVNATKLARLLDHQRDTLKLVLLNACEGAKANKEDIFSSIVGGLMQNGVLSVIAMQQEISDRAAITFSHHFYSSIADGMPIDTSMSEARTAMHGELRNTLEWGIPVLYMRAPDGVLFKLPLKSTQPSAVSSKGSNPNQDFRTNARTRSVKTKNNSIRKSNRNAYETRSYNSAGSIGAVVQKGLKPDKFKRYNKGIKSFGFFFFSVRAILPSR